MFSVKCPLCSNPLIQKIVLEDKKYYFEYACKCAAVTNVFCYRLDYETHKPVKITIFLDLNEKSYLEFVWYEKDYIKASPLSSRWWEITLRTFSPAIMGSQCMMKGDSYLSPEEGWDLLNRCKKLLVFS